MVGRAKSSEDHVPTLFGGKGVFHPVHGDCPEVAETLEHLSPLYCFSLSPQTSCLAIKRAPLPIKLHWGLQGQLSLFCWGRRKEREAHTSPIIITLPTHTRGRVGRRAGRHPFIHARARPKAFPWPRRRGRPRLVPVCSWSRSIRRPVRGWCSCRTGPGALPGSPPPAASAAPPSSHPRSLVCVCARARSQLGRAPPPPLSSPLVQLTALLSPHSSFSRAGLRALFLSISESLRRGRGAAD